MPSTTSNYGWTYPISSDDLNAGATTIGSMANGIDTSLNSAITSEAATRAAAITSEAATRAAADTANTNLITSRIMEEAPVSASRELRVGVMYVTTNSSGVFTLPSSTWHRWMMTNCYTDYHTGIVPEGNPTGSNDTVTVYGFFGTSWGTVNSITVRIVYLRWQ